MAIMSILYAMDKVEFLYMMNEIGLTQGNLSSHITKLETAKYIVVEKTFVGKRPKTFIAATEAGRLSFKSYMKDLNEILKSVI